MAGGIRDRALEIERKSEKRKSSNRSEEKKGMKKTKVCERKKVGEDKENAEGRAGKRKRVKQERKPLNDLIGEISSDSDNSLDSTSVKRAE